MVSNSELFSRKQSVSEYTFFANKNQKLQHWVIFRLMSYAVSYSAHMKFFLRISEIYSAIRVQQFLYVNSQVL